MRTAVNAYHWEVERKSENGLDVVSSGIAIRAARKENGEPHRAPEGLHQSDSFRIETIVDEVLTMPLSTDPSGSRRTSTQYQDRPARRSSLK